MRNENPPPIFPNETIYPVLLAQIYSRTTLGIIATVVNASVLSLLLKNIVPRKALMIWFSTMVLFALIRFFFAININRHPVLSKDVYKLKRLLIVGVGVTGILWGSTAVFFYPAQSIGHQALIAFVLAGMVAGAVSVFSPIMPVYIAFSIPALIPILIRFTLAGDGIHMAMATMTLLFGILTYVTAKYMNTDIRELVSLKESFSNMLDVRTEALRETNKRLEQEVEKRTNTENALLGERDKLQQMIAEVKTLRGFIPICSSCKKIRDDAGYWQKIEKYIQERSEAKFSHGICPECSKKIYPEFNNDV